MTCYTRWKALQCAKAKSWRSNEQIVCSVNGSCGWQFYWEELNLTNIHERCIDHQLFLFNPLPLGCETCWFSWKQIVVYMVKQIEWNNKVTAEYILCGMSVCLGRSKTVRGGYYSDIWINMSHQKYLNMIYWSHQHRKKVNNKTMYSHNKVYTRINTLFCWNSVNNYMYRRHKKWCTHLFSGDFKQFYMSALKSSCQQLSRETWHQTHFEHILDWWSWNWNICVDFRIVSLQYLRGFSQLNTLYCLHMELYARKLKNRDKWKPSINYYQNLTTHTNSGKTGNSFKLIWAVSTVPMVSFCDRSVSFVRSMCVKPTVTKFYKISKTNKYFETWPLFQKWNTFKNNYTTW